MYFPFSSCVPHALLISFLLFIQLCNIRFIWMYYSATNWQVLAESVKRAVICKPYSNEKVVFQWLKSNNACLMECRLVRSELQRRVLMRSAGNSEECWWDPPLWLSVMRRENFLSNDSLNVSQSVIHYPAIMLCLHSPSASLKLFRNSLLDPSKEVGLRSKGTERGACLSSSDCMKKPYCRQLINPWNVWQN
jgi:hypothetical protein